METETEKEKEKEKKKLKILCLDNEVVEPDEICGIESSFIRMNYEDKCYRLLGPGIQTNTLKIVLYYCKKRAIIKLQNFPDDDENSSAVKRQLDDFDSEFLRYMYEYRDETIFLDLFDAALSLHIKSLYDLVINHVVHSCAGLTFEQIHKIFHIRYYYNHKKISDFNWAFHE